MLFVQAVDGGYYTDPYFRGHDWAFHYNEEQRLGYIRKYSKTTPDTARRRIIKVLAQRGVGVKVTDNVFETAFMLQDWTQGYGIPLRLTEPILKPDQGEWFENADINSPMVAWSLPVFWEDIKNIFLSNGNVNRMITKFLFQSEMHYLANSDKQRSLLKITLPQYLPRFRQYKNIEKYFADKTGVFELELKNEARSSIA